MEVIKIGYRLLQLVSLIIFLNQAWVTMVKFWERPVIQEVSVERHEDLKYDIYLCHLDGFDADKGEELGYRAPFHYFSGTLDWYNIKYPKYDLCVDYFGFSN